MRNYLSRYPDFPVVSRGIGREGYKFDIEAVNEWRNRTGLLGIRSATLGTDEAARKREYRESRERLENVKTQLLQLELDKKRGYLVDRDDVISEFAPKVVRLANQLEMLPRMLGKKFGLSNEMILCVRDYLDQARLAFVRDDTGFFSDAFRGFDNDETQSK